MLDTPALSGTRWSKTSKNFSHSILTANHIAIKTHCTTPLQVTIMDNDNSKNQKNPDKNSCNLDRYTRESTLRYHWGADDEIMKIINRWDNSLETREVVEKEVELTRPGHMRFQWHKKWTEKSYSPEDLVMQIA